MAGVDPSMGNMTIMTSTGETFKVLTAPEADKTEDEIRRLQQKMAHSLRINNPDNYDEKGAVKKGAHVWKRSKAYERLQQELTDLFRRKTATRKCEHGRIHNFLLQIAGTIRIEENNWKAMQKVRYGKSVLNGAPSEFITKFKSKAERAGCEVQMIDPKEFKPSQHSVIGDVYVKHELWERRVPMGGSSDLYMDRDAAAALNIMCADPGAKRYDLELLAGVVQAAKPSWLSCGVVVENPTPQMRASDRELRRFLRKGLVPKSVEECMRNRFLKGDVTTCRDGTSDVCHEERSSLTSETPSVRGGLGPRS